MSSRRSAGAQSASVAVRQVDRFEVALATRGGTAEGLAVEHPFFFDGFLQNPEQAAEAMLLVSRVARTRFFTPMNMVAAQIRAADPVVSCDGQNLRFESFSPCCGVYARLDLRPGSLEAAVAMPGTTNVDFNDDMRGVLAGVGGTDPLHLNVGEAVTATSLVGSAVEERVPLPDRWVKGFAESQISGAELDERVVVTSTAARQFIRSLPATSAPSGPPFGVAPTSAGLRLTTSVATSAVRVGGPERLRILEPLLRFATAMRVSGPSGNGAAVSQWQLDLDDAHLTLVLSPAPSRGFSGEGGVLDTLVDATLEDQADDVLTELATVRDPDTIAANLGLAPHRVIAVLGWLGAAGLIGYDGGVGEYFHRELPLRPSDKLQPRLAGAHRLVEKGVVTLRGDGGEVGSGSSRYQVRDGERVSCTCLWFAQFRLERGPCKHLLAVRIAKKTRP